MTQKYRLPQVNQLPRENPMDRGGWWATVHRIAESDTTEVTEHKCTQVLRTTLWKKK